MSQSTITKPDRHDDIRDGTGDERSFTDDISLTLRAAVVGTGSISSEHLTFLSGRSRFVDATPGRVAPVAVCDLSPVSARYAAETFDVPNHYTDLERLLEFERPDVVHILTPPSTHVQLASLCLEAGAHVICEKPVAASIDELEALLDVADRCDRKITESHNYCFNPAITDISRLLDDGTLGQLREVEIRIVLPVTDTGGRFGDANLPHPIHSMPAGVIHDFTTHFASLLLHFTGHVRFHRAAAAWSNHSNNPLFRFDDLDALMIGEGPDGPIHGRFRFDAGAGPDTFTVRVYGSRGWAETDLFQPNTRVVIPRAGGSQLSPIANHVANGAELIRNGVANLGRKVMQRTPYEGLHLMLDETYRALATGDTLPVTNDDMRAVARLVDQLLEEKTRL